MKLSWFSTEPTVERWDRILNKDTTVSFHFFYNSFFTDHTIIQCHVILENEGIITIIIIIIIIIKERHINRHGKVCAQMLCNICKEVVVKLDKEHKYDHVP